MQPDQPPANYDFIMNAGNQPKRTPLGGGNNSMVTRLLIVLGGLFLLAIIAAIVLRLLGGAGTTFDKKAMLAVAQDQTEIIRLSSSGAENSVSQQNKNFSITTKLSMASEQQQLLEFLDSKGYKPNGKELPLKQDAQADSQLEAAKSSSTFDSTYTSIMRAKLQTYQNDLKAAYKGASPAAQQELSARFDAADLLLTQLNSN